MPIQHLLVVEDDPRWREQLGAAARAEGCEVALAADGLEALAYLREHAPQRPQLVLLDLLMPRMDGWELYGHMRQESALRQIPLLLMSAAHLHDLPLGGVVGILHKPSQPEALLPEVRERLRLHGLTPALAEPRNAYALHLPPELGAQLGALPPALRHAVRMHLHRAAELAGNELPLASTWLMALPGTPPSLMVTVEGVQVVLDLDEARRTLTASSVLVPPELRRA
jgi:CheY-like chemotaxis protein